MVRPPDLFSIGFFESRKVVARFWLIFTFGQHRAAGGTRRGAAARHRPKFRRELTRGIFLLRKVSQTGRPVEKIIKNPNAVS